MIFFLSQKVYPSCLITFEVKQFGISVGVGHCISSKRVLSCNYLYWKVRWWGPFILYFGRYHTNKWYSPHHRTLQYYKVQQFALPMYHLSLVICANVPWKINKKNICFLAESYKKTKNTKKETKFYSYFCMIWIRIRIQIPALDT